MVSVANRRRRRVHRFSDRLNDLACVGMMAVGLVFSWLPSLPQTVSGEVRSTVAGPDHWGARRPSGVQQAATPVASRMVTTIDVPVTPPADGVMATADRRQAVAPQSPSAPQASEPVQPQSASPPPTWTAEEVSTGRAQCARVLSGTGVVSTVADPIRAGVCGAPAPIVVSGLAEGAVTLMPEPTLNCAVAAALARWVETVVQPAALELLGTSVTGVRVASSYACRNRNGAVAGPISEHAFANALDIVGLALADGRTITVDAHWGAPVVAVHCAKGDARPRDAHGSKLAPPSAELSSAAPLPAEARFLRRIHAQACGPFRTVLGPGTDAAHRDHFHLDMKARRGKAAFCQ